MPQRQPSPEEWATIVRAIDGAQDLLRALPRDPELDEAIFEQTQKLERANELLGYDPEEDQFSTTTVAAGSAEGLRA